jgi:mRNA interferase MazF
MKRGDIVTVAIAGDYGKPRPAVVIQSDSLDKADNVLVCLITSTRRDTPFYRLDIEASAKTGLRNVSQIMIDKIMAVRRDKCGASIGKLAAAEILQLDRLLAVMTGIAG